MLLSPKKNCVTLMALSLPLFVMKTAQGGIAI